MYRDQDGLNRDLILANRRQRRRWRGSQADFARSSLRLIRIPSNNRCPPNSAPNSVANRIALSGSSLLRPFATHAAAVASTMGKVRSLFRQPTNSRDTRPEWPLLLPPSSPEFKHPDADACAPTPRSLVGKTWVL